MTNTLPQVRALEDHAAEFLHVRAPGVSGNLKPADQQVYDSMLAGIETLKCGRQLPTTLGAERFTEAMRGDTKPASYLVDEKGKQHPILGKGDSFLAAVEASAGGPLDGGRFDEMIEDGLTSGGFIRSIISGPRTNYERAALQNADSEGGGYTVPTFLAANIIDLFRARNQVVAAGAQTFQMESDTHKFARVTSHPTAAWVTEIQEVPETTMTFGQRIWEAKNLRVLIKCSRNLIEDSRNIDALLQRELSAALAAEVDRVALFGEGAVEPLGLRNEEGVLEEAVGGALTGYDDVLDAYKRLLDANAPDPTALLMSNREWAFFAKLKDLEGRYAVRPPAIGSLPFLASSKLPTNLGGGAASEMYLGHFPDLAIGIMSQLRIEVLRELYAATHQFGFLAHLRMQVGTFHDASFCKLTGITPA